MPKSVPKRGREALLRRLQRCQHTSKASPRTILDMNNLENIIFATCTVHNHKFWKCQGAHGTPTKNKSGRSTLLDWSLSTQKRTPKLDRLKIVVCAGNHLGGAGPWTQEMRLKEMVPIWGEKLRARQITSCTCVETENLAQMTFQTLPQPTITLKAVSG